MREFYDVFQELIKQEDYVLGIKVLGPSIVPYPPDLATPSRCACSGTELASHSRGPTVVGREQFSDGRSCRFWNHKRCCIIRHYCCIIRHYWCIIRQSHGMTKVRRIASDSVACSSCTACTSSSSGLKRSGRTNAAPAPLSVRPVKDRLGGPNKHCPERSCSGAGQDCARQCSHL